MGSLVPGWDAGFLGVPPKELQDVPEDFDEPKGYFAKLEKQRSSRHSPMELGSSLSRLSAPASDLAPIYTMGSLKRTSVGSAGVTSPMAGENTMFRRASVDSGHGRYQGTDWSSELNTLRPKGSTDLSSLSMHRQQPEQQKPWWQRADAGMLNEHLEADVDEGRKKGGSFTPQFNITGQGLHYDMNSPSAGATATTN